MYSIIRQSIMKWQTIFLCGTTLMILNACDNSDDPIMSEVEISKEWNFTQADKEEWYTAEVPGSVHSDLIRNELIEDPFYRLNEHDVQWVDKKDWIYQTTLNVTEDLLSKDRLILDFNGLDTHADVFLNDEKILVADNMFRGWEVDVKGKVKSGANELKIYFHSPIKIGLDKYDNYPHQIRSSANDLSEIGQVEGNKKVGLHIRKAGYHFGWDWGPRLVTSGIWKSIFLKGWNEARMVDLRIVQNQITEEKVTLTAELEIEAVGDSQAEVEVNVDDILVATIPVELTPGTKIYSLDFEIANPELWWSNGLGDSHLYKVTGKLKTDNGFHEISHNTGIRTVELVREEDQDGKSFFLKLNGHKVFMKGANYIPNDVFLDRVTPERYEEVILTAKKSNHNMLRVWGGGIYEKDIFYDLCDKHGILIWQDFMFAINMMPGHPDFLENVKQEAEYNIKRLRNHPSVALWCGNNETLAAWKAWGWEQEEFEKDASGAKAQWKAYQDIFLDVLPTAVNKLDPQRFYHPSSPQAGDSLVNVYNEGDNHYWGVWWGKEEFSKYHTELSRFMSEYGFQSFPEMRTINRFAVEEDWDIYSEVMKSHQRSSIGNSTIELYMLRDYQKPKDFPSFIYAGQLLQAEGVRQAFESHRIAMPYNMGSLYWQINDCWPVASWSSTDYYGNWKALQYFVKKAFEEVLVASRVLNDTLEIHVVSDRLTDFEAEMEMQLLTFNGELIRSERLSISVKANSSQSAFAKPIGEFLTGIDIKTSVLALSLKESGVEISRNNLFFDRIKNLYLPANSVEYSVTVAESGYVIELSTDVLAKNVYLSSQDSEGFFSDNYFDMLPGERRKITFSSEGDNEPFVANLKVLTLRDTY